MVRAIQFELLFLFLSLLLVLLKEEENIWRLETRKHQYAGRIMLIPVLLFRLRYRDAEFVEKGTKLGKRERERRRRINCKTAPAATVGMRHALTTPFRDVRECSPRCFDERARWFALLCLHPTHLIANPPGNWVRESSEEGEKQQPSPA